MTPSPVSEHDVIYEWPLIHSQTEDNNLGTLVVVVLNINPSVTSMDARGVFEINYELAFHSWK